MRRLPRLPLLALAACSSSVAPLPREGAPEALEVRFGGYGYGGHDVVLRDGALVVTRRAFFAPREADSTTVVPDAAAWRAFWAAAHDAGVGRWPRECRDDRIADGSAVVVRVVAEGRVLASSMSNAWPTAAGRCTGPEQSEEIRAFLSAVSTLIGQPYPG